MGITLDQGEREKLKREKIMKKKEEENKREEYEAQNVQSYLTNGQYKILYESINGLNEKLHGNGSTIDVLERKLLELLKAKEEK